MASCVSKNRNFLQRAARVKKFVHEHFEGSSPVRDTAAGSSLHTVTKRKNTA